ncbi:glycosyltransferase [Microbispora triticiradicis]|uniref:glycosyltransferase n=1 Tax=Microbispora TaxID=2005 RepID=UPI00142EB78A|nr:MULTISPECIES: glycosyltransferase [Microbispora]
MTGGVRIPLNDYGVLGQPPAPGEWTPTLTVSVVIPAHRAEHTLPLTLASLARQTYPAHLTEVVVVDDGERPAPPPSVPSAEPSTGPSTAPRAEPSPDAWPVPERLRVVRPRDGAWGRASACAAGAEAAEGQVILYLDADLVLFPEHVEAQMRWHHLADHLVVLGHLRFVPGLDEIPASEVLAAVEAGTVDKLFAEEDTTPQWTEGRWDQTDDLRAAGFTAFSVMVGATASLPAALLRAAGGLDASLVLGEDTELGYRLAQAGAVFVPDRRARCWHLGRSTVMRREPEVKRHNWPYLAERVPVFRWLRRHPHRTYLVPYVEVVVAAEDASFEEVRATVDGVLAGRLPDVRVTVTGPWGRLRGGRRDPLGDPSLDLRLMLACYEGEPRVRFRETVPDDCFPVPFRFHCPPGWVPSRGTIGAVVKHADRQRLGIVSLALDEREDGEVVHARLERTAAVTRARRCARPGDDLDDLIHEMFGTVWDAGDKWGLLPAESAASAGSAGGTGGAGSTGKAGGAAPPGPGRAWTGGSGTSPGAGGSSGRSGLGRSRSGRSGSEGSWAGRLGLRRSGSGRSGSEGSWAGRLGLRRSGSRRFGGRRFGARPLRRTARLLRRRLRALVRKDRPCPASV